MNNFLKKIYSIKYTDILQSLRLIGIENGDTLYVASSLASFAFIENSVEMTLQALYEAVGIEGTIVMPSFSFSFCDHGKFDRERTPSRVGILSEAFRQTPSVLRTFSPPYHTVCVWGSRAKYISSIESTTSFGIDSVFQYLYEINAKVLLIGCSFNDGVAHLHWLEERHKVEYRYRKKFAGLIIINDIEKPYTFHRFVRKNGIILDASHLGLLFETSGKLKLSTVAFCRMACFKLVDFAQFFDPLFEKDKNIMIQGNFFDLPS
jgi:aminoglycoside 3-N-acetyltransferase